MKCLWLFAVSIGTTSDDSIHRNKSYARERCLFYFNKCGIKLNVKCCNTQHYLWKLHHWPLSELKTLVFPLSYVLDCVSIHCMDQKQHSNPDFLTKSLNITLQACIDKGNEYLQAYDTGAGNKSYVFCSPHFCKCAGYTMFLITFVLSN